MLAVRATVDERTLTPRPQFDFLADGDPEAIVLKDGINANHDAEDYKIEIRHPSEFRNEDPSCFRRWIRHQDYQEINI